MNVLIVVFLFLSFVAAKEYTVDVNLSVDQCYTLGPFASPAYLEYDLFSNNGEICAMITSSRDCDISNYYECGSYCSKNGHLKWGGTCNYDNDAYIIIKSQNLVQSTYIDGHITIGLDPVEVGIALWIYCVIGGGGLIVICCSLICIFICVYKCLQRKQIINVNKPIQLVDPSEDDTFPNNENGSASVPHLDLKSLKIVDKLHLTPPLCSQHVNSLFPDGQCYILKKSNDRCKSPSLSGKTICSRHSLSDKLGKQCNYIKNNERCSKKDE